MSVIQVIAIFDVGKTNKKLFLLDEHYKIVYEKTARFTETVDEDNDPCENLESLRLSVFNSLNEIFALKKFDIKAINFSTYGASLVYVDERGEAIAPLYNYLKDYPEILKSQLYQAYGGEQQFSRETASPALGSLNAGLQFYRIKKEQPELFARIKYALHLPQYLSSLVTGSFYTDITSIGCHTALWDFERQDYHCWVSEEGIEVKFPPLLSSGTVLLRTGFGSRYVVGVGLHDSSAALIPYQLSFADPFVLLSTGTWCISMNPSNQSPLTLDELKSDCLCYLQMNGNPVKSSRLFLGPVYEQEVKRIAEYFGTDVNKYRSVAFDVELFVRFFESASEEGSTAFSSLPLSAFEDDTCAYYHLMMDLVQRQKLSTCLILEGSSVKRIFVTGGFSKNPLFMSMLAQVFPEKEVFAAAMPQATAVGAAMAIHKSWNSLPMPNDVIQLKYYAAIRQEH